MTDTTENTGVPQPALAPLRAEIEDLVTIATGRVVTADDLRATGGSLDDAGVNSIGYINLLEALEQRYGLVVDPETDPHHLRSVDSIAHLVRTALA